METFFKNEEDRTRARNILLTIGLALALFLGMKFINEVKAFGTIGSAAPEARTIDVIGSGEAFAIPDVARLNFTVTEKGKNVHDAQVVVAKKIDAALAFLKTSGIAEKDIKTVNYNVNPEYSYPTPCYGGVCPTSSRPVLLGYNISQTITVKIRNTDDAGKVTDGLGSLGITSIDGPDFAVDEDEFVRAEARKNAIENAKEKAKVLSKDLGVRLVRIVRFTDGGSGGYPTPMYAKAEMGMGGDADQSTQMPAGENKYSSTVTITYEIR